MKETSKLPRYNTKHIAFVGYLLMVAVMITGIFAIYHNLVEFSEKKVRGEDLSELIIVGNTMSKLYKIESSKSLFTYHDAVRYFKTYDSIIPVVYSNLDTLKVMASDSRRIVKLDSIRLLLAEKNNNLRKIVALLDSIEHALTVTYETTSSYIPKKLNTDIVDYLDKKEIRPNKSTASDTTVMKKEKKGFLARVKDVFVGPVQDSTVIIEKKIVLEEKEFKMAVDTIINMVRHVEKINFERHRQFQVALFKRQTIMNQTNSLLTTQIDELLKTIENEEIEKNINLLREKNNILLRSEKTIAIVSWIAFCLAVFFGLLFLLAYKKSFNYRKQLEESNANIQSMYALQEKLMLTISHDIKSPMNSILGYIELMTPAIPDTKLKMYLENMKKSGEHIVNLVMGLLDYHKLESGSWVYKKMNFNLADFVDNVVGSFRPIAILKQLELQVQNEVPASFETYSDPYMIRQIMGNIISNAIKYTSSGGVFIHICTEEKERGYQLKFSVRDTGMGFYKHQYELIFDRFEQLDAANIDGVGLGLAITKRLVTELNGTIQVSSEKNVGSQFIITLPIEPSRKIENIEESTQQDKEVLKMDKLHVLLVDDDRVQLAMISEMLRLKKNRVEVEDNPQNVLSILRNKTFDILFIDIQMPYMNGFSLVKSIRDSHLSNTDHVPIVALSGKSDIKQNDIKNAGFTDFLMKPFSSSELYSIINKHVGTPLEHHHDIKTKASVQGIDTLIDFVREDSKASVDILDSFIKDISTDVQKLKRAFETHDALHASQLAHKMLPMIQMVGERKSVSILKMLQKKQYTTRKEQENLLLALEKYLAEAKKRKEKLSKKHTS